MAHICINGISSKSAGGKSILTNFLRVLNSVGSQHHFTIIVPALEEYKEFIGMRANIVELPFASKQWFLPFTNAYILPRLLKRYGCDIVFNLSDLPIPTRLPQLFLFDWAYAAYTDSIAWRLGGTLERLKRNLKLYIFKKNLIHVDLLIAQGHAIRYRLMQTYGIKNIPIVPNAVSLDNIKSSCDFNVGLPEGYKLLCLSRYYSHKNFEIFLDLADFIIRHRTNWKIVITVDQGQSTEARRFLDAVKERELSQVIWNIGPVDMKDVPTLYRRCDSLLLPTLLESFSGTYVEAMYHGKAIFTSNYEFAHDVCGDSAWYFDPLNAENIFNTIGYALRNPDLIRKKILKGNKILNEMPDWNQAYKLYMSIIDVMLSCDKEFH